MRLTVRDIQKIQAIASAAGCFYNPNKDGIGLLDRGQDIFATDAEADADYKAHQALHPDVPLMGYLKHPVLTLDMFPALQEEYAKLVSARDSETYNWNGRWRVILEFFQATKGKRLIPADLVTPEALAELFAQ